MALTMERILFAALPIPASILPTWAVVAHLGVGNAPYYLFAFLGVNYFLLVRPRVSSFLPDVRTPGGEPEPWTLAQGPVEAAVHTLAFALLPSLFYVAVHHAVLLDSMDYLVETAFLGALPLAALRLMGLKVWWWLSLPSSSVERLVNVLTPVVGLWLVACFQYRILFRSSLAPYLASFPAPWNYALVSASLLGVGALAYLHSLGVAPRLGRLPLAATLLASALSAAVLVGMPLYVLPAVAAACFSLVWFYSTRAPLFYALFVASSTLVVFWFMHHAFWFLDVSMHTRIILTWNVHLAVLLLCALFVLALVIPGLAADGSRPVLTGALLAAQASLFASFEQILFDELTYPPMLIVATSAAGIYLADRMERDRRITPVFRWLLSCVYLAKLALLLYPLAWAIPSALALLLTVTPIHYFIQGGAGSLSGTHGIALAALVGAAAVGTRGTLIRRVLEIVLQERPSPPLLWAAVCFVWGAGIAPLATRHFSGSPIARRFVFLILAMGVLFAVVQPPLDWAHVSAHVASSLEGGTDALAFAVIRSSALHRASHAAAADLAAGGWPRWMLFLSLLVAAAAGTRTIPLATSDAARFFTAVFVGLSMGLYYAGTFLAASGFVLVLTAFLLALVATIVVFLHYPTNRSGVLIPVLFCFALGIYPVLLAATGIVVETKLPGALGRDVEAAGKMAITALYAAVCLFLALNVKAVIVARERRGRASAGRSASAGETPASPFSPSSSASSSEQRLRGFGAQLGGAVAAPLSIDRDLEWVPAMGNFATVLCFALSVHLNIAHLDGSETCAFFLSPLLLLLHRDATFFRWLTHDRRYFPLIATTSAVLTASAAWSIVVQHTLLSAGLLPSSLEAAAHANPFSAFSAAKGVALLAVTSATLWRINQFLYSFKRQGEWAYIVLVPLNFLPIVAADTFSVSMLGAMGLVGGAVVLWVGRSIHIQGSKFI